MTDLSVKNRIIALSTFALVSIGLTMRNVLSFNMVFFACMGLVVFFADKILNNEKIKECTLFSFFIFGSCYQTFYQLFNRVHENGKQFMVACALAIFLAAVFAATDSKKFTYVAFCVPLICLFDVRTASAYCVLLLSFSIFRIQLEKDKSKKGKKSAKKKSKNNENTTLDPLAVVLITLITSVLGLAFSVYFTIAKEKGIVENPDFLFTHFKNTFGFTISAVYLLIKLIKSKLKVTVGVITGLIIFIVATVFFTTNYGWSVFSLFLISVNMFLGLVCLESEEIINEIKADYHEHKYILLIGLLCLLQ